MKLFLFLIFLYVVYFSMLIADEHDLPYIYKNQKQSLINWKEISPLEWFDYQHWLEERFIKDQNPNWRIDLQDEVSFEDVGKVLDCVGSCRVYRGEDGFFSGDYLSKIVEGDELVTGDHSYAWIYLLDGTMVRLSPNSSISFKEINISREQVFYYSRLNFGSAFWLSRDQDQLKELNERETDSIFLPLKMYNANNWADYSYPTLKRQEIFGGEELLSIDKKEKYLAHYKKLNELIKENNKEVLYKKSTLLMVLPNATILSNNPRLKLFTLLGSNSYVKNYSKKVYFSENDVSDDNDMSDAVIFFRGITNSDEKKLDFDIWYDISADGREYLENIAEVDDMFYIDELLLKRIPSVLIARELFLKDQNKMIFQNEIDDIELATNVGMRLWDVKVESEIAQRISFLKEYTKKVETNNLFIYERIKSEIEKHRDFEIEGKVFSRDHYIRAYNEFKRRNSIVGVNDDRVEMLNSTLHPRWHRFINKRDDTVWNID